MLALLFTALAGLVLYVSSMLEDECRAAPPVEGVAAAQAGMLEPGIVEA